MKSPQDSSGEETKYDSREILQEILTNSVTKNENTKSTNVEDEIRQELVSYVPK